MSGRHAWEGKMSDKIYDVPADWAKRAYVDDAKYREMYARSVNDPNGFWAEQARRCTSVR
jgi:acetyl-CoA synthetase